MQHLAGVWGMSTLAGVWGGMGWVAGNPPTLGMGVAAIVTWCLYVMMSMRWG